MKKTLYAIMLLTALTGLTACVNDDTDFDTLLSQAASGGTDSGDDGDNGSGEDDPYATPMDIALDTSALEEGEETVPTDDNDYVENSDFDYEVTVSFSEDGVTLGGDASAVTVSSSGGHVLVNSSRKNVAYVLQGSCSNGSFKIYSEHKFKLTLNGLTLHNPTGAAINNQCGKALYVVLADGTVNTLTDGTMYVGTSGEDMRGTLFSEGQIIFSGTGELNVEAHAKNGIASDDYIMFRPGCKVNITNTANNGIRGKDAVIVRGGVLNIEVSGDAAKGINTQGYIEIEGGRTTILTSGSTVVENEESSSSAGVKCDSTFTMTAGTLNIQSSGTGGKGINAHKDIYITGGEINAVALGDKGDASPKGIKGDMDIKISGGSVYTYSAASDPLSAKGTLTVADGYAEYINRERVVVIRY